MAAIRDTQKRYGSAAMTLAIVIGFGFILAGFKPEGKGLILGALFSVVNFVLMGETLAMRVSPSRVRSTVLSFGGVVFRHLLLAVPLILALRSEAFDLLTTAVGMFMVQIVILGDHLVGRWGPARRHPEKR